MGKRQTVLQRTHSAPVRTPALDAALLAARIDAPALVRDRRAAPSRTQAAFAYPSQESIQEAERGLLMHGLLLVDLEQDVLVSDVELTWRLTHVESGEERIFRLTWPMFSDIKEHAHARAACWSHAREKLVCHLLQLRVLDDVARPEAAQTEAQPPYTPSWQAAPAASGAKVTSTAAPPYTPELLATLVQEWAEARGAVGGDWVRVCWEAYLADRHPLADPRVPPEYQKLYYWLADKKAGVI